jgi:hypothetical protein
MKQKSLSLDDHRELAKHLYAIDGHISAILKIVDGRVPVAILDQLLSGKPLDMKIFKLRDSLRNHMYKQHGPLVDKAFGDRKKQIHRQKGEAQQQAR